MNSLLPPYKVERVTGVRIDEHGDMVVQYSTQHTTRTTKELTRLDETTREIVTELITKALYNLHT